MVACSIDDFSLIPEYCCQAQLQLQLKLQLKLRLALFPFDPATHQPPTP